jgi:D-3-phosphoglycerate dehydrogenase
MGNPISSLRFRTPAIYTEVVMDDIVENLILDLLEWVDSKDRTYFDTMDAWRTSCPKLPVWEDANDRGLVETDSGYVRLTPAGVALLNELRPRSTRGRNSAPADPIPRV